MTEQLSRKLDSTSYRHLCIKNNIIKGEMPANPYCLQYATSTCCYTFFLKTILMHLKKKPEHTLHAFDRFYRQQKQFSCLFQFRFVGCCLNKRKNIPESCRFKIRRIIFIDEITS